MSNLLESPDHWLARAKDARELAATMSDPVAKRAMLEIAERYEKVAKRSEAREAGIEFTAHQKFNDQH